jgi:hypothetical protein
MGLLGRKVLERRIALLGLPAFACALQVNAEAGNGQEDLQKTLH